MAEPQHVWVVSLAGEPGVLHVAEFSFLAREWISDISVGALLVYVEEPFEGSLEVTVVMPHFSEFGTAPTKTTVYQVERFELNTGLPTKAAATSVETC